MVSSSTDGAEAGASYSPQHHFLAAFCVLGASAIGASLPLLSKYYPPLEVSYRYFIFAKAIGTGVVLGVALIHLLHPAAEQLRQQLSHTPYFSVESSSSLAFTICLSFVLLMHTIEAVVSGIFRQEENRWLELEASETMPLLGHNLGGTELNDSVRNTNFHSSHQRSSPSPPPPHSHSHGHHSGHSHAHGHYHRHSLVINPPSATGAPLPSEMPSELVIEDVVSREASFRARISALMMGFGTSFHSLFIGFTLGSCGEEELFMLTVALCMHQFFEGLALGTKLVESPINFFSECLMAVFFTSSAPLTAFLSIVAFNIMPEGFEWTTFSLIQGFTDASCAGILLYLGFGLMHNDFFQDMHLIVEETGKRCMRLYLIALLWLGGFVMVVIGIFV